MDPGWDHGEIPSAEQESETRELDGFTPVWRVSVRLNLGGPVAILTVMSSTVKITTGARLHFGPLAASGPAGGAFGGVGMMVSAPGFELEFQSAPCDSIHSPETVQARIAGFVDHIRRSGCGLEGGVAIAVRSVIPEHAGLGSGTQLGLAIARGLGELAGQTEGAPRELARWSGRGLRSAIGLHGFGQGGFLVDGGRGPGQSLGTLVSRLDFPRDWRWILVTPQQSQGLSGNDEQAAFQRQPAMPASLTGELCRIALMDWLPGVIEADFRRVSDALYEFGLRVGEFFAPVQGGVFANPQMRELAEVARVRGIRGVAQTSWGPTLGLLCETATSGESIAEDLVSDPRWHDCTVRLVAPLNSGARVEAVPTNTPR